MNIKRIIREEIGDFDWAKDTKSNQDIAQEIADKSEIKDDGLYTPFLSPPPLPLSNPFSPLSFSPPLPLLPQLLHSYFFVYCKEQYGIAEDDIVKDIWNRYKKLIKNKINNLNESIKLPIEIGDTVYMGRFKNKKVIVKDIKWNKKGDLMINGKSALRVRIPKKKSINEGISKYERVKEEIGDFDWIDESSIEVGKCFILKSNNHGDLLTKVSKIVAPKNTDKLNDLTISNRIIVHFDMTSTGYPAMMINYSKVENYINSGDIVPCDCPTVKESKNKLIKESGVENYLQSIASITSGNQKKYYNWILSNLEKVSVVSYRSNEELKDKVDSFVKRMRRTGDFCEKKGCFDTAYNTAMYVPGVHYIEGYVQSIIPIVHAWNYLPEEGIYFDLINDIAWKEEDSHFNEYYKVIDLDKNGVLKWSSKTGYGGGFMESPQFIDSIVNKEY